MLLAREPRIRRAETAPLGRSSTGRGIPDISLASGIAWPLAVLAQPRAQRKEQRKKRRDRLANAPMFPLWPLPLWPLLPSAPLSGGAERLAASLAEFRVVVVGRRARRAGSLA